MFLIYTDALSSMYTLMKKLSVEITEENYDTHLTADILLGYNLWMQGGGQVTAEQFRKLGYPETMDILDYIAGASLYEVIENNGKEYRLVHAGPANFAPDCACVSGGKLAAFCVETEEVIYVDGRKEQNHALCDWRYSQ